MKKFCQCIGLASLLLVTNYGDLLGGGYDVRMHVPFPLGPIILAQIADIFLLGLLLFAILTLLSRTRARRWVALALALLIPPVLLLRTRGELPFPVANLAILAIALLWAGIVLLLLFKFTGGYRVLLRVGEAFGVFLAVFAVCSILQLLFVTRWKPGPHQHSAAWSTSPQPPRVHPRMVWIVFDELSYDQLFAHRAPGLALPAFDALAAQSTVFTDVQPIGRKTVKILPSLLSGATILDYRFRFSNHLAVHTDGVPGFHPLTGADTLFADAHRAGWRTAATGWYNPYCTVFASVIDDCYWTDLDKLDGPMEQTSTLAHNILAPLQQAALEVLDPPRAARDLCDVDVRHRYLTYIDLEQHASKMLADDQADFVFLHLPVPHSPAIWDRATHTYTRHCGSSYLDGLALADHELGRIMTSLHSSPRWSDTTVIVQGDHSWRTYIWKLDPAWTPEDTRASHNAFDPRPAVLIHQPNQTQPHLHTTPWSLLNLHEAAKQTLQGAPLHF